MDFINLIFRLGVVLAIFSFIWGLFKIALTIIRSGRPLSYPFQLALKLLQYFLIADVAILFATSKGISNTSELILTGLILLLYFLGKMHSIRSRFMFVQMQGISNIPVPKPNMALESGVIVLAMGLYTFLCFNTEFTENKTSLWFFNTITDIENTPIFGFIFSVVGFFFTINILFRMANAISYIISGKAFQKGNQNKDDNQQNDGNLNGGFDDYEEVD